jgi:hypothetical protein
MSTDTDQITICRFIAEHQGWSLRADGSVCTAAGRAISGNGWAGFSGACILQGWISFQPHSGTTLPTGRRIAGIVIEWDAVRSWAERQQELQRRLQGTAFTEQH